MKKPFENQAFDIDAGVAVAATFLVTVGGLMSLALFVALTSRLLF